MSECCLIWSCFSVPIDFHHLYVAGSMGDREYSMRHDPSICEQINKWKKKAKALTPRPLYLHAVRKGKDRVD